MERRRTWSWLILTVGVCGGGLLAAYTQLSAAGDSDQETVSELAQYFGFGDLELFKLQQRSTNMLPGDFNHDGLTDLVLVDNSNSRIDLLQQRKERPDPAKQPKSAKINAVENDWRFEHRKLAVDKAVASLAVGDFNGDGRTDIAYLGLPDRLMLKLQPESGEWPSKQVQRLPDLQPALWMLAAGDLNSDKKDDLVVLGKNETYVLYQKPDGTLGAPEHVMNTSDKLQLAQIADLDGDGRADLCYTANDEGERTLCARLQTQDGHLGPEMRFELEHPRAVSLYDIDNKAQREILTIHGQTGRVKLFQLQRPEAKPGELAGQLIQYGFGQQGVGRDRDLAIGDITSDGKVDVVVTDPEAAQMIVYQQVPAGDPASGPAAGRTLSGLDQGHTFPGLTGTTQVRIADLDGDKRGDVVVLSPREKAIGISRMDQGRLTFPQSLAPVKDPVALDVADLNGDGRPEIVYISKDRSGATTSYALHALERSGESAPKPEWKAYRFGDQEDLRLPLMKGDPERLVNLDADGDGKRDFLIFYGSDRPPLFLKSNASGVPVEVAGEGTSGLGSVTAAGLFLGQLDGPAILVAQNNFARNLKLGPNNQWQVVDQYNAAESNARIAGVAALNLDGEPGPEIVLVDLGVKKLRVLRRDGGVYRPWREVEIGSFSFKSSHVADLNGDGLDDLLLFGAGKFGVLYAGQTDPKLQELASYESKLEQVHFSDLVAGDLNGDGRPDIALIDTRSQYIEILDYLPGTGLRHALAFKVFEAKSLSGGEEVGSEPREALITDVTGDKRADLVLLSQDRVLVYPQDPGENTRASR